MVLTRAMHKARVSNDNCSNTKTKPSDRSHETSAVVHGDAARVAVDKHTSARSKGTKSDSALKPELSKEDKLARSRYRAAVPKSDAVKRPSGRKSSLKIEDIDLDCLLGVDNECYGSVDTDTSAYRRNRGSTESRSSSVESLLTPPPPCMEEDEQVLLHHDFDAMIPLDAIPDEDERNALDRAYLRQLQENRPDDEADVDAVMADDRYRSLAPEPDQGLVDAIRSGRIAGLASPERSVREE
ncbi:hypothetical protein ACEPAF_2136 [Sanghuangporus sanghuang]